MARDYRETVRALRAKAADPVVSAEERIALLEKAAEMEERHGLKDDRVKPLRDETTITDRSGHSGTYYTNTFDINEWLRQWQQQNAQTQHSRSFYYRGRDYGNEEAFNQARYEDARRQTDDLLREQAKWNRPPDEDDLISEDYKTNTPHSFHTTDDEDYGYDEWIKEGDDYDA